MHLKIIKCKYKNVLILKYIIYKGIILYYNKNIN